MKYMINILVFIVLAILFNHCSTKNQLSNKEIESRAINIAQSFDSANIEVFRTWSYIPRGQAGIWYRNSGDSSLYRCIYLPQTDSAELTVISPEGFLKDFNADISFDTSIRRITIVRVKSGILKIIGVDNKGKDVLLINSVSQDSIFPHTNPLEKLKELTELKDSLGFYGVNYYEGLGGMIEFNLSAEYVLIFLPNIDLIEPPFRKVWESNFSKGQWIKRNWNFRKIDKPIDNS